MAKDVAAASVHKAPKQSVESAIDDANDEMAATFGVSQLGDGNPMSGDTQPIVGGHASEERPTLEKSSSQINAYQGVLRHTEPAVSQGLKQLYFADEQRQGKDDVTGVEQMQNVSEARQLSHVDEQGRASMVDVSQKAATQRIARASAQVVLGEDAFQLVKAAQIQKGDVLSVAQLAGVMGAKHTGHLIPLCHPLLLTDVQVTCTLVESIRGVDIQAVARCVGQTGVEMEAMTAASVAALTVYDMCKAVGKGIAIKHVRLEQKSGGKSGTWTRQPAQID